MVERRERGEEKIESGDSPAGFFLVSGQLVTPQNSEKHQGRKGGLLRKVV